jgi:hypothetical protein
MVRRVCLALLVLLVAATSAAQGPPPPPPPAPQFGDGAQEPDAPAIGTGAISGVVTDGATGRPLAGAYVQLTNQTPGAAAAAARPRQMTDSKGRFIFTRLVPSANYIVVASRPGYLDGGYKRLPGAATQTRISLIDGGWFSAADVSMWKPAAIRGTIRDERGEPLVGMTVRVLMRVRVGGVNRWAAGSSDETDDRGEYRIAGLQPGAYIVQVPAIQISLPSGEVTMYATSAQRATAGAPAPTRQVPDIIRNPDGHGALVTPASAYQAMFHPSAQTITGAEIIDVTHGDEHSGADVSLRTVPTVTVSGTVSGPADAVAGLPVRLVLRGHESLGPAGENGLTKTDATGAFTFVNVPEGDYTLIASRSQSGYQVQGASAAGRMLPQGSDPFVARMSNQPLASANGVMYNTRGAMGVDATGQLPISVGNRALTGLTIPLSPTVKVSGHFVWDGNETPPSGVPSAPSVRIEPADGDVTLGIVFAFPPRPAPGEPPPSRFSFTLENVLPGRYLIGEMIGGATWTLAAAEWNGRDILASGFEVSGERDVTGIVFKMVGARTLVTGAVRMPNGEPASDILAVSFPVSPAEWPYPGISALRFRSAAVASDGSYRLNGMIPGEYFVAAIPVSERGRWLDPAALAALAPLATRITVKAGATTTQDLRVTGGGK